MRSNNMTVDFLTL